MKENRDFKGVWIPKEIWLNTDLSIIEKVLLVEIDSLDNSERGCFASNEYLASFVQLSEGRVANIISDLKKRKFIIQVHDQILQYSNISACFQRLHHVVH